MILVVDPTVLFTKRGNAWVDDAVRSADASVLTSGTFLQCLDGSDGDKLGVYRPRAYFGFASLPVPSLWLQGVTADSDSLVDDVGRCLADARADGRIAADLWYALKRAAYRNTWLVAQRMTTLDQLVRAGVRLIVEGHEDYMAATREIELGLGVELTKGMVRCARFLVSPIDRHPEFAWSSRPTLVIYDRGTVLKR